MPNGEEAASIISDVCRHIGCIIIIIIIIIIITIIIGIIDYYFGLTQFRDRPAGKGNLLGKCLIETECWNRPIWHFVGLLRIIN